MVGGREEGVERAQPIFAVLGKSTTHIGDAGAGQVTKAANQVVVALTIQAVAEALVLARKAGVDPARVREALLGGFAQSRILELHGQRMLDGDYDPGFKLRLHRKDLTNALQLGREAGVPLFATAQAAGLMDALLAQGAGDRDHAALATFYEQLSGVEDLVEVHVMRIGVLSETAAGERRVALVPDIVRKLHAAGHEVIVEAGAGESAGFGDRRFVEAGAAIGDPCTAELVVAVRAPDPERLRAEQVLIGFLSPLTEPERIQALAARGVTAFAMESVPRISRAQSMDALSSQATVSGYKAVLIAASEIDRFFPMLMTAAGTIRAGPGARARRRRRRPAGDRDRAPARRRRHRVRRALGRRRAGAVARREVPGRSRASPTPRPKAGTRASSAPRSARCNARPSTRRSRARTWWSPPR